jgi:hypothetical protein
MKVIEIIKKVGQTNQKNLLANQFNNNTMISLPHTELHLRKHKVMDHKSLAP